LSLKCHDKFKTRSFHPEKETENKNEVAKTKSRAEGEPHQKTDIQSIQTHNRIFTLDILMPMRNVIYL